MLLVTLSPGKAIILEQWFPNLSLTAFIVSHAMVGATEPEQLAWKYCSDSSMSFFLQKADVAVTQPLNAKCKKRLSSQQGERGHYWGMGWCYDFSQAPQRLVRYNIVRFGMHPAARRIKRKVFGFLPNIFEIILYYERIKPPFCAFILEVTSSI